MVLRCEIGKRDGRQELRWFLESAIGVPDHRQISLMKCVKKEKMSPRRLKVIVRRRENPDPESVATGAFLLE